MIGGIIKTDMKYSNSKIFHIFNLSNKQIIVIHQEKSKKFHKAIFIKNIIKKFIKNNNKNEISFITSVQKYDINSKIYFLDNYDEYHNNLKELNELNTELYIIINKYEYCKYFVRENEGKLN